MKGYMENPELKISSLVFLLIMGLFLVGNFFLIKANNEQLKEDYIHVFGSITGKVIANHPELEKEIVPLLTREVTVEEAQKGMEILSQYGLSSQLETQWFPYLNHTFLENELGILCSGLLLTLLLWILNYFQYGYFYRNIRNFSTAAKKIVEGDYNLKLSAEREGDLSKLTHSFNSMGEVIRNHIYQLKKEKVFLVDLLSDISHQLKTPLSTLIINHDILLTRRLSEEQSRSFLLSNQNQLHRIQWLIQSLLKLAKIDANAIELEMEEQCLNETIEEVIEILASKAEAEKVTLDFKQSGPILMKHDRLWLQEALINVMKNGIEHSEEGDTVTVELIDNPIFTRIIVQDQGEGIEEKDLANIFNRFYKVKNKKKTDSVGIGLSLAKSIVEKHKGYIEVKSKLHEGTTFMITFIKHE